MMVIQLARLNSYRVFAVAGLQNASCLQSLGTDIVVDPSRPQDVISEAKPLRTMLGIDCVGQQTATCPAEALHPSGKLVLVKQPNPTMTKAFKIETTDVLIKSFHEDAAYGQSLVDYISYSLLTKALRPIRYNMSLYTEGLTL